MKERRCLGDWVLDVPHDAAQARELLAKHNYRVGLVGLDTREHAHQQDVEHLLLNGNATEWVALVSPDCLTSEPICSLLPNSFFDYHTLPVDPERLLTTLGHAYGMSRLREACSRPPHLEVTNGGEMVGQSEAMRAVLGRIRKVAGVDAPLLITGESGTGKELAARAIHRQSQRADGPFVAVNCGALPSSLVQSELFGYEKGAFTGASQRKIGRIEAASGGVVFLDEIGDVPSDQQVNLLRFLQEGTIERVGATQSVHVDVRVIAATHRDLEQAVRAGTFREDLYYRLNVLQLHIPPLREREGDVELLAHHLFDQFSSEKSQQVRGFSQQALTLMRSYEWPGNVRELVNRVRRAMVMCEGRLIAPADLGLDRRNGSRQLRTLEESRAQAEMEAIRAGLRCCRNNMSLAAKQLGISRVTLYRMMRKYQITVQ